jgi:hypothetical protein
MVYRMGTGYCTARLQVGTRHWPYTWIMYSKATCRYQIAVATWYLPGALLYNIRYLSWSIPSSPLCSNHAIPAMTGMATGRYQRDTEG